MTIKNGKQVTGYKGKFDFEKMLKGVPLSTRIEVKLHFHLIDFLVKERKWDKEKDKNRNYRKLTKLQGDAGVLAKKISDSIIAEIPKWKKDKAPLKHKPRKK